LVVSLRVIEEMLRVAVPGLESLVVRAVAVWPTVVEGNGSVVGVSVA